MVETYEMVFEHVQIIFGECMVMEEEELAVEHGEWQDEEQDDDTCFTCAT